VNAEENREEIRQAFEGADLVYITAGMGGGTGTGAAPVVAQIAKDMDILSIGIVTLPFKFEGKKRMRQALEGKKEFSEFVNTLITIPNDKILESLDEKAKEKITMEESFILADSVLAKAAIGVTALIKKQGHINLDFADVKTVVKKGGSALMGIGEQTGDGAAEKATRQAMTNPLLLHGITGAKGVIMNFTSSKKLSLMEITRAAELVEDQADEDADIIFGHVIEGDDWPEDKVEVTIVATGFEEEMNMANTWSKRESREVPTVATSPTYSSQPDVFITSNKNKDSSPIVVEKEEKEIKKSQQDTYYDSVREMEREIEKSKELDIPSFLWKK
jgi:cell division protein FtsZ